MNEREMSVLEHIEELRRRLVIVVVFFLIAFIGGFFLAKPMILYLQQTDEAKQLTLNAFRLTDPLFVYLQFAIIIAFVIIFPVILYQLWAFISPGLYKKEQRVTLGYIPIAILLFLSGISFSYFILFPFIIDFMINISNNLDVQQTIGLNEYFTFLWQLTLPFGILFQLPVVIMFLTRLGIITPQFLTVSRKYAYFVLLVVATLITPPELMSHLLVTVPLLLLYEFSIVISRFTYRRTLKKQADEEEKEKSR
ncbi:twin-arginine translocase subunit TatC [Bacillus carboniphilus]|uniref:Sec-independent protein translocase protein TatC n=1 Tax=Bacillus carboniphilus TaxID=86663 RepID=A0ABY9JRZ8_9BACI|nr:twin-arginine translocase subunit TatC [Bacillus carboniphilus]WLR42161.1 twin-arginine translocase subunit TatC [Bacillus carboniphilus]